jgi:undecaprenyl-diphosphatase
MFQAIILGILQGLTEFIPVSSTAHLILLPWFLGWQGIVDSLTFDVALHFGTLLALLVYFRKDWINLFKALTNRKSLIWLIAAASVPAGAAGLVFHDIFENMRDFHLLIAFTLSSVAVLMIIAEKKIRGKAGLGIENISIKDALIIGFAQALALIPGVSRSGITITAGLFSGFSRETSARFSFLMSTPVVLGASLLDARKVINSPDIDLNIFLIGILSSAIAGYLAIKYLLIFFKNHSMTPFAYYRFLLAFVMITTIIWG